jgi:imidazole glycerol-phosphate synthase subunit HisF
MRGNRLVKGVGFDNHKDAGNPVTTVRAHNHQGADELVLLDIDASREKRGPDLDTISEIAKESLTPLTVGGGISDISTAIGCMNAGADKLTLTSSALDGLEIVSELARLFGRQAVVLGVNIVNSEDDVFDHRTMSAVSGLKGLAWAKKAVECGAGEIRLTFVDREGSRAGLDLDQLARYRNKLNVPIVVEGGVGNIEHLLEGFECGADGIGCGTILVFSDNNIFKIKRYLSSAGLPIRK